jgi:MYXO-CTERM domain-containing protein
VLREFRSASGLQLVKLPEGMAARSAQEAFRRDPAVLYAEPNYLVKATATPNDPEFPRLWGLHNTGQDYGTVDADIDAPEAWALTTGGREAVVAVLDTGVDYSHPDLAANMAGNSADCDGDGADDDANGFVDDCHGIDVANGDADPMDDMGHGTHVAGIIGAAGNDGVGVVGVNWRSRMLACKFLNAWGDGSTAGAIACLDYVADLKDRGVNVVATNNSWGGGDFSQALADAIDGQRRRGILFVTSAGNSGDDTDLTLDLPCAYPDPAILCVGASDSWDELAGFSSFGRHSVHLVAPGVGILSTVPGAGYETWDGTSMAAPHVTGAIALLHAHAPGADWRAVRNRILAGGDPIGPYSTGLVASGRRLNVHGALTCTGSRITARLRPLRSTLLVASGAVIELAALNVDCATPNGEVAIPVSPGGGTVTLKDGGLGADVAAGDGIYSGAWTAGAAGDFTLDFPGTDDVRVKVDPDLQPGFPRMAWTDGGDYEASAAIHTLVGNLDGEPNLEILATGLALGPLLAFEDDGSGVRGWPVWEPGFGAAYPALGKLTASPGLQVVASYRDDGAGVAYDGSGVVLPGWPVYPEAASRRPPLVADVDGDGFGEVFLAGGAFRADGGAVNPGGGPATGSNSPAAADLLGDGTIEILYASEPIGGVVDLRVVHPDGSPVAGFPVSFFGREDTCPVVGDVDGDGAREIVVVGGTTATIGVLIYDVDGTLEREVQVAADGAPALADLNGDGILEIVLQSNGALAVVRGEGDLLPGWPVAPLGDWMGNSSPVVGDVDGDGRPDVVFTTQFPADTSNGFLHVYGADGVSHPRFPKALKIGPGATPAIADIDLDGRNEIVVTGDFWDGSRGFFDKVWVFDLGGPAHGPVLWGQFMGNAQHTGTAVAAPVTPPVRFTLGISTTAGGSVTSAPAGIDCGSQCSAPYDRGTSVTLTAAADPGYRFEGWSGACEGQIPTCTVLLDAERTAAAEFALILHALTVSRIGSGGGTVSSTPAGIDCGATCDATFERGTAVTLTAVAESGSVFAGWTGACAGQEATCLLSAEADLAVSANFEVEPPGGDVPGGEVPGGGGCGCGASPGAGPGAALLLLAGFGRRRRRAA